MIKAGYGEFDPQIGYAFLESRVHSSGTEVVLTGPYRRWGKRFLDIFLVLAAVPFAVPTILISLLLIKIDGGKGLFAHPRIGQDARVFRCWKLRTMVANADDTLAKMMVDNPSIAQEWEANQKLVDDPRITRVDRILRKTSIDELPQLWNVLVGDMSLVGPRPFTPEQRAKYDGVSATPAYYHLRPGITGLWQVKRRNDGGFLDRHQFDEDYYGTLSFWCDVRIFVLTIKTILRATGR